MTRALSDETDHQPWSLNFRAPVPLNQLLLIYRAGEQLRTKHIPSMSEPTYKPSSPSAPNAVHRLRDRAKYDSETVWGIVDENVMCHVTFRLAGGEDENEEWPVILPMGVGRIEERIFLHGHLSSRLMYVSLSMPYRMHQLTTRTGKHCHNRALECASPLRAYNHLCSPAQPSTIPLDTAPALSSAWHL